MSPSRLDDWAEYVEYSILLEFFQERYPTSSGLWDRQVRRGVDPTAPIQATAEAGENAAEFNRLIAQGKRRPKRPQAPSHHTPWTRRVPDDIYNFHAQGYRVQGLLPAVAMHVDDRDYGSSAGWAHRQLHIIKALSGDIHNATSSVPHACFEQWAQDTERTLWALCSEGRGTAGGRDGPRRVLVLVGLAMGLCGRTLSARWCFALMPVLTMGQVDEEAEPAHQDLHLPQWMMAAVQTGESLQRRGVDGGELLGHLHAAVTSREVPHYHEFALQLLQILRILLEIPAVAHHPGVLQQDVAEWTEFAERHIVGEYLAEHHRPELALHHQDMIERGVSSNDPLPEQPHESAEQRDRRLRFNLIRQESAFVSQLRAGPLPAPDLRGHCLTWTGAVIGDIYDGHMEGYDTTACLRLLYDCVARRRFEEYEEQAHRYLSVVHNNTQDFRTPGIMCTETLAAWAAEHEGRLWQAFVLHGLDMRGLPARPRASGSSSSSTLEEITGDEARFAQKLPAKKWMKGNDYRRRRSRPREPERRSQHSPTRRERCTRETLNLARVANRHRSSGSRAAGGADRPKPKTRPSTGTRPSSTTTRPEPSGAGSSGDDPMPMTMSMAVDTWMLVLGLRGINDTACDAFLQQDGPWTPSATPSWTIARQTDLC